ncbi:MAG: HIT family protein [Nitrososphaerales archaeon]
MDCVFCSVISKKSQAAYVFENGKFIAFMDKYPINRGHTLVLPKEHYQTIFDMAVKDTGKLFTLSSQLAKAVMTAVNADGFTLGQNNGEAANQVVPHVHVHIVPRFSNDSEVGRWPTRKTASIEELNDIAAKIRNCIEPISL